MSDEPNLGFSLPELQEVLDAARLVDGLEPIAPAAALESYLEAKSSEYEQTTLYSHRSRLSQFIRWCDREGITDLNQLTGRDVQSYRTWRRADGELAPASEKTQQDTLRVFLRWCESIEAVHRGLAEKVLSPALDRDEGRRSSMIGHERVQEILTHLRTFEYASLEHVLWEFLAETGLRTGGIRAVDVGDYYPAGNPPHIELKHRPESGTPIKNKHAGERFLAISPETCTVFDDFLEVKRPDVVDEYGREPFLATKYGRLSDATVRKYVYKWTRPCVLTRDCPHGRDLEECPAAVSVNEASQCPSSRSPHAVRRGYITHELERGVPKFAVSERCSVSEAVIDRHYDQRAEKTRMRQRKDIFDSVYGKYGSDGNSQERVR